MQVINKQHTKNKLAYTWYIYPLILVVSFFTWFWSFGLYHQPSAHQKLVLFFGAQIKDLSFTNDILNKFDNEVLKKIEANGCSPRSSIYASKLNVYLSNADLLVLPEKTMNEFATHPEAKEALENMFRPFNEEIKNDYVQTNADYFTFSDSESGETTDYGVLVKGGQKNSWLSDFVELEDDVNYYLVISTSSVNTGKLYSEENELYVNALNAIKYLLGGAR